MGDVERVVIDPNQLKDASVEVAEKEIEVPQLNQLMGLGEGEVAIVKIRQLELNEYLRCRSASEDKVRTLIEGVIAAAESVGELEEELVAVYKEINQQTKYYIDVCTIGVIEPKMLRSKWTFLAKRFPMVVEKIAVEIILLTKGGASVKKNS
jgi:hypothetical protein